MAWEVDDYSVVDDRKQWTGIDSCEEAYRPTHIESGKSIPAPFRRRTDAERACVLLNLKCPCNDMDAEQARAELRKTFGSVEMARRFVVAECCAW